LVVDATKRASLSEIAQHPWMSKGGEGPIDNYFPIRLPVTLPLDDEVVRGMTGFEFGTEEEIRRHLTTIIQSSSYMKACEQYARLLEAATSSAIAEKSEKRKPFSLEFYKRKSSTASGSWPENGVASATSLQFDDPTNAFDPLLSIYSLVREKQERDRQSTETLTRSSNTLSSPKSERALRLPTIPVPEAAHTSDPSYEISTSPGKGTYNSPSFRSKMKSRGDEDLTGATRPASLGESNPASPRSRLLEDLSGTKGGGLFRRISHKWSKEPVKESKRESKISAATSTPPQIEIATPSRTLAGRKSREIDLFTPSSPQRLSPSKDVSGLGRSTSVSEGDYRKRHAGAVSDDESSTRRRSDWPSSPQTPTSADSAKSTPGSRTRSMGHARHATISAARRANDRRDRDFWSGPLTGPSTIVEEGKEASRNASSRPHPARDDQFSKPVHLKGLFSVATTSTKSVPKMRADLIRVLDQIGISHDEIKGGFFCMHRPSIALGSVQESIPQTEEFSGMKKARRRLSFGAPIVAAAQFAGFGGAEKRVRQENESDNSAESVTDLQGGGIGRAELSGPGSSLVVQFEIYIVKFPWLSLHGIQFKRVGGDVWQYKNACVKILAELNW
jgi:serine/threonine protein kinase KIN1/2